jgi:hypothetical protein
VKSATASVTTTAVAPATVASATVASATVASAATVPTMLSSCKSAWDEHQDTRHDCCDSMCIYGAHDILH